MSPTPPVWSLGLLLPLVLLFSAMASIGWYHWSETLGLSRALSAKASFLVVEVLGILLPALGLAQLLKVDPEATFPTRRVSAAALLSVFVGTLGLSILLTYLQDVYQKAFNLPYPEALLEVLTIHSPVEGILLAAGVVLAAAICEEALFRGYVQSALQEQLKPAAAIALTALLFAAFHLEPAGLPTYLILGAWLGWLRYVGHSLWLPILAHGTNNLLALIQANVLGEAYWTAHVTTMLPLGLFLAFVGGLGLRHSLRQTLAR
ncbi:CAAX amino terminal protease self- immunity [compost metagenome]